MMGLTTTNKVKLAGVFFISHTLQQDALDVPTFATSAHARVADALLEAYRSGDADTVGAAVAVHRGCLMDLDSCVARVVKTLPTPEGLAAAAALGGAGEEPDLC